MPAFRFCTAEFRVQCCRASGLNPAKDREDTASVLKTCPCRLRVLAYPSLRAKDVVAQTWSKHSILDHLGATGIVLCGHELVDGGSDTLWY